MSEHVQNSTNPRLSHYWDMFARSGDPQMYLKFKRSDDKGAYRESYEAN